MSQDSYAQYLQWAIDQANQNPDMRYDSVRARFVVNGDKYFPTYLQAKWYLDYIKKFGFTGAPQALFGAGERGVWYDVDLTTAFKSTTDLTPCAIGDGCGFLLDKSQGAGYSGSAFTGLGSELVTNGDFGSASGWVTGTGWAIGSGVATKTAGTAAGLDQNISLVAGRTYLVQSVVTRSAGTLTAQFIGGTTVNGVARNASGTFSQTMVAVTGNITIRFNADSAFAGTIDNISVRELPGFHATQINVASRPILRQTGGGLYYLEFDGLDDAMSTASINFTGTDEMSVFAGVRNRNAAPGAIAELSVSTIASNGAFILAAREDVANYYFASKGTILAAARSPASYQQPITNTLTALSDISGDSAVLRVNGVQVENVTTDQGTGNYGNHRLFIGARGGTSVRFNGHLYSLIVRGKTSTADEIALTEKYVAAKTGVTL